MEFRNVGIKQIDSANHGLKAMGTVKEYVRVTYPGQEQILTVYQYVCYIDSYSLDANELLKMYKQRFKQRDMD